MVRGLRRDGSGHQLLSLVPHDESLTTVLIALAAETALPLATTSAELATSHVPSVLVL